MNYTNKEKVKTICSFFSNLCSKIKFLTEFCTVMFIYVYMYVFFIFDIRCSQVFFTNYISIYFPSTLRILMNTSKISGFWKIHHDFLFISNQRASLCSNFQNSIVLLLSVEWNCWFPNEVLRKHLKEPGTLWEKPYSKANPITMQ